MNSRKLLMMTAGGFFLTMLVTLFFVESPFEEQAVIREKIAIGSNNIHQPKAVVQTAQLDPVIKHKQQVIIKKGLPTNMNGENAADSVSNTEFLSASGNIVPWGRLDSALSTAPDLLEDEIEFKQAISFRREALTDLPIGKVLELELTHHRSVSAVVKNKRIFTNGDISWGGHLEGYGDRYPVVITVGKKSSFGTITTPEGEFALEVYGDNGWIYEKPDMSQFIDTTESDVLIPGIDDNDAG